MLRITKTTSNPTRKNQRRYIILASLHRPGERDYYSVPQRRILRGMLTYTSSSIPASSCLPGCTPAQGLAYSQICESPSIHASTWRLLFGALRGGALSGPHA